jgi:hypothetical protein
MKPEDVPADLVKLADEAVSRHNALDGSLTMAVLATVLTEHDKQVRAQASEEIMALRGRRYDWADAADAFDDGIILAARAARGDA